MSRLSAVVFPIAVLILAITSLNCDDYNIVEPRFYSEDDLVEFAICEGDPYAEQEGASNSTPIMSTKQGIPNGYEVDACWFNRAEGILAVFIALPIASDYTVSLINSGGGVEAIIDEGSGQAGQHVFPCIIKDNGVYAISLQAGPMTVVVWFEVK